MDIQDRFYAAFDTLLNSPGGPTPRAIQNYVQLFQQNLPELESDVNQSLNGAPDSTQSLMGKILQTTFLNITDETYLIAIRILDALLAIIPSRSPLLKHCMIIAGEKRGLFDIVIYMNTLAVEGELVEDKKDARASRAQKRASTLIPHFIAKHARLIEPSVSLFLKAAYLNHPELLRYLLGKNIDIKTYGHDALFETTRSAAVDTARLLLDAGVNPNQTASANYEKHVSPLFNLMACPFVRSQESVELLHLLFKAGVNPNDSWSLNAERTAHMNPLFRAVFLGEKDLVAALVDYSKTSSNVKYPVNVKVKNPMKYNVILFAVQKQHDPAILRLLIANGAADNLNDSEYETILASVYTRYIPANVVELLFQHWIKKNPVDFKRTPLEILFDELMCNKKEDTTTDNRVPYFNAIISVLCRIQYPLIHSVALNTLLAIIHHPELKLPLGLIILMRYIKSMFSNSPVDRNTFLIPIRRFSDQIKHLFEGTTLLDIFNQEVQTLAKDGETASTPAIELKINTLVEKIQLSLAPDTKNRELSQRLFGILDSMVSRPSYDLTEINKNLMQYMAILKEKTSSSERQCILNHTLTTNLLDCIKNTLLFKRPLTNAFIRHII